MEIGLRDKFNAHPFWSRRTPTDEQWAAICAVPAQHRFKQGDEIPEFNGRVFWRYFKKASSGLLLCSKESLQKRRERCKTYAKARYVKKGRRTKTEFEKKETALANCRRNKAAKIQRHKERMATDPEYAAHVRQMYRAKYQRHKATILKKARLANKTPQKIIERRIRNSLRRHVDKLLKDRVTSPKEGARFLYWLAKRLGIENDRSGWHVDHIIPLSKFDLTKEGKAEINAPENLRWLTVKDNLLKGSKMPTEEEVAKHLELVKEWRQSAT